MSMDDPGWDSPGFDDEPSHSGWNEPATPANAPSGGGGGASGGPGGPPVWQNPKYLGIGGGAVALIVIIVLIVLLATNSGGNSKNVTNPTPTAAAVTTSASPATSPTPAATPTPTPVKTKKPPAVETIDQYDKKADHVCSVYKPKLVKAEHAGSISTFVKTARKEFKTIKAIKKPPQGAEDIRKWITDAGEALKDVQARNINAYNASILHADTIAGELGMHICNYGH